MRKINSKIFNLILNKKQLNEKFHKKSIFLLKIKTSFAKSIKEL